MTNSLHQTVLLDETLDLLDLRSGLKVFEGTAGDGGLTSRISEYICPTGTLLVTDLDEISIIRTYEKVSRANCQVIIKQENFSRIKELALEAEITLLDRIVLDLGLSSTQIEQSGRGFSFMKDEPLQMTFKSNLESSDLTASEIVNNWKEESLTDIFWGYGGEHKAKAIAKAIVKERKKAKIESTSDLVGVVENVVGNMRGKIHPATKVFQALRIAVNDELGALKKVLRDGWQLLAPLGRIVVVSFHELEDREVKNFFKERNIDNSGQIITTKPVVASRQELSRNVRARSAKLRAIIKK